MPGGTDLIGAGVGGLLGGLTGSASVPSAMGLTNKAISQYYYGLNPKKLGKLNELQAMVDAGNTLKPGQQQKLDKLTAQGKANAILPQLFSAQQQWNPQFQQESQQLLQGQATALGNVQQNLTNQINPQYQQVQGNLGNYVNSQIGQGLSPDQLKFFGQQLAEQQAAQGLYGSPLSSQNMAYQLTGLNLAQQQQNIGNAMQYGSAYPNVANQILGLGVGTSQTGAQLAGGSTTPTSFADYSNLVNSLAGLNYQNQQNQSNLFSGSIGNIGAGLFGTGANFLMGGLGGTGAGSIGQAMGTGFGAASVPSYAGMMG